MATLLTPTQVYPIDRGFVIKKKYVKYFSFFLADFSKSSGGPNKVFAQGL